MIGVCRPAWTIGIGLIPPNAPTLAWPSCKEFETRPPAAGLDEVKDLVGLTRMLAFPGLENINGVQGPHPLAFTIRSIAPRPPGAAAALTPWRAGLEDFFGLAFCAGDFRAGCLVDDLH